MKITLKNTLTQIIVEARSTLPQDERVKIVADVVIKFMDYFKTINVPTYQFLANWKPKENDTFRTNMKTLLGKYLGEGEYDIVKSFIKEKKPEFIIPILSRNYKVDENVVVKSNGEVIVYNTFKMNGITLQYEPKDKQFKYMFEDKEYIKKPDFYYKEQDTLIEVAGLDDLSYKRNYSKKLQAAKERLIGESKKIVILDYLSYRNNHKNFYKYVCETFGFDYNPKNFDKVREYQNIDKVELEKELRHILDKSDAEKTRIEKYRQENYVKILGYEDVFDYKRKTGYGLKWSKPELREKAQIAWCQTKNHTKDISNKFKEIFPNETLSSEVIRMMKINFPEEFKDENKKSICKSLDHPLKPKEIDLSKIRWADPELKNKVKKIWCETQGTTGEIQRIFRVTYPLEKISEGTINLIKTNFPNEFDESKRGVLCNEKLNEYRTRINKDNKE